MKNLILGGVGILWGLGVLLYSFLGGGQRGSGAYGAGQAAGTLVGLLLLVGGVVYLCNGVAELKNQEPRRKPRRRKRRRREDDEE